jgi:hypothetical protein
VAFHPTVSILCKLSRLLCFALPPQNPTLNSKIFFHKAKRQINKLVKLAMFQPALKLWLKKLYRTNTMLLSQGTSKKKKQESMIQKLLNMKIMMVKRMNENFKF